MLATTPARESAMPRRVYPRPKATCAVADCGRPAYALGYCGGHWRRWRRYGDAMADVPLGQRGRPLVDPARRAYEAWGIRCAPLEAFREWYGAAMMLARSIGRKPTVNTWCVDGWAPWCERQRRAGKCLNGEGKTSEP